MNAGVVQKAEVALPVSTDNRRLLPVKLACVSAVPVYIVYGCLESAQESSQGFAISVLMTLLTLYGFVGCVVGVVVGMLSAARLQQCYSSPYGTRPAGHEVSSEFCMAAFLLVGSIWWISGMADH